MANKRLQMQVDDLKDAAVTLAQSRVDTEETMRTCLRQELEREKGEYRSKMEVLDRKVKALQTQLAVSVEENSILTKDLVEAYHEVELSNMQVAEEVQALRSQLETTEIDLLSTREANAKDKDEIAKLVKTLLVRWKD